MKKYLVISTVGDESLHHEWIKDNPNFDLVLIYYGNNQSIAQEYINQTPYVYSAKGEKYHLLKSFILSSPEFISNYSHIWTPDNDVSISTENINLLFEISDKYNLNLAQPAMNGYISHALTSPQHGNLLRYTNFVEVLAPLMDLKTLMFLKDTFDENYSGWGYDFLWPYMLEFPEDKIAIIDKIIMTHTKPVGTDYSRFPTHPSIESQAMLDRLAPGLLIEQKEYSKIKIK
jgi:hypothetical protein